MHRAGICAAGCAVAARSAPMPPGDAASNMPNDRRCCGCCCCCNRLCGSRVSASSISSPTKLLPRRATVSPPIPAASILSLLTRGLPPWLPLIVINGFCSASPSPERFSSSKHIAGPFIRRRRHEARAWNAGAFFVAALAYVCFGRRRGSRAVRPCGANKMRGCCCCCQQQCYRVRDTASSSTYSRRDHF
eukprot:352990-Chlamydomonas_euryale.AAC.3